jgi:HAD superfamily hydrolase (TIGR01493 family)
LRLKQVIEKLHEFLAYSLLSELGCGGYLHLIAHARNDTVGGLEYIGAAQDLTQRRLAEEALVKARQELANATRLAFRRWCPSKIAGARTTLNRRDFVSLAGAGAAAAAFSAEPTIATVPGAKIKAIAFDGLAVFDVRPVAALAERVFPGRGDELSALWRRRQFEYTWLRTIGRQYADFWQVTEEALVFSCKSLKLELTRADSDRLMQSYLELKAWPDALAALKGLKASGLRMAFLSNFTAAMLDQAVKNSSLEGIF